MHFFISRAGEDREWGVWVAKVLKEEGHQTFLQDDDIQVGNSFPDWEKDGMEQADHLIARLSPDYLRKEHTMAELNSAWARDPQGKNRLLIPVRVRECEIPEIYAPIVYMDLRERDGAAKQKLLAAIGGPKRKAKPGLLIGRLPT